MSFEENKVPILLIKPIRKNDLNMAEKETLLSGEVSSGVLKGSTAPRVGQKEKSAGLGAKPLYASNTPVEGVSDFKKGLSKFSKSRVGETKGTNSTTTRKYRVAQTPVGGIKGESSSNLEGFVRGGPNIEKNGNGKAVFQKLSKKVGRTSNPSAGGIRTLKIMRQIKKTNLNVGDICILKISALGPNGIGIDEYSYPFSIFVPNTNLKETVKAKIVRVNLKGNKYAIAKILKVRETPLFDMSPFALPNPPIGGVNRAKGAGFFFALQTKGRLGGGQDKIGKRVQTQKLTIQRLKIEPNQILTVNIQKLTRTGAGLINLKYGYKLIVPQATIGKHIKILVTRLKSKYGFAKIVTDSSIESTNNIIKTENVPSIKNSLGSSANGKKLQKEKSNLLEGSKYTLTLPNKAKKFGTFLFLKLQSSIIFLKLSLNAKPGDQVRIKITKVKNKFVIAKIIQINPLSLIKKRILIRNNIRQMIQNGMHLGEKAVKCNARMKNYVWLKQQSLRGFTLGSLTPQKFEGLPLSPYENQSLGGLKYLKGGKTLSMEQDFINPLLPLSGEFGAAKAAPLPLTKNPVFGSRGFLEATLFTPPTFAMGPQTPAFAKRGLAPLTQRGKEQRLELKAPGKESKQVANKIEKLEGRPLIKKGNHIINLLKTRRCLNKALTQLTKYALKGRTFLFIGTKKAAAGLIARASLFSKNSFFVNTRWLGGLLTNWKTIRKSISKIRPILQEKQKIIADILEKRKRIKMRLIKKGLFIKNKTQLILKQGRSLLAKLKNSNYKAFILEKTKTLALKQKELLENCQVLVSKHKALEIKRRKIMYQNIVLKQHIANTIITRYNNLLRQLTIYTQKLRQLKYFLILRNEIKKIKTKAHEENTKVLNIDSKKIKTLPRVFAGPNSLALQVGEADLMRGTAPLHSKEMKSTGSLATINLLPQPPKDILNFILLTVKNNSKAFSATFKETDFLNIETKSATNNKTLLVSDFVSSLSRFVPELKNLIQTYEENINFIKTSLTNYSIGLNKLKITLRQDIEFHQRLIKELIGIKTKLISQCNIIRIVKAKLNHFARQKRVVKFLPRLRHFKISAFKNKIISIVQILMRKIVDPKLKYPVDNIYNAKLSHYSKKIASARKKKWQRFEKYFGGIAKMTEMRKSQISKNVAIIIGQNEEMNAIRECQKLGIKTFNIVDTNCNPTLVDHIIPANDDSRNSIKYVLNKFLIRIRLAQKLRKKIQQKQNKNSSYKKLQTMANQMRKNFHLALTPYGLRSKSKRGRSSYSPLRGAKQRDRKDQKKQI